MVNAVPRPGWVSKVRALAMDSTSVRETARPRPRLEAPPTPSLVVKKGSKTWGGDVVGDAGAEVGDRDQEPGVMAAERYVHLGAWGADVDGVLDQVEQHLAEPVFGETDEVWAGGEFSDHAYGGCSAGLKQADDVADHFDEVKGPWVFPARGETARTFGA